MTACSKASCYPKACKAKHKKEPGHWEIDTVVGRRVKHNIVALVYRMTDCTFIGQMDDRTTESLSIRMSKITTRADLPFKIVTSDNGTELMVTHI